MRKKVIFLIISICLLSDIYAQTNVQNVELNQVEVSADRTKMYSDLGRVITTIEKIEIEQAAVKSIDDLLDYVGGIDVRRRGVDGVQADIYIRGGSFDQILVLLNGVNITDPQTGHYNLDIPIDIADISRVEILQGSAARVLGPNAFSGAINIITNENHQSKISTQISTGSYGYLSNNVSGNYVKDNFRILGSGSYKKSDGYINNTDFNIANGYIESGLRTGKAGNFDLQMAYQQKSFGANSFYSLTYPNQFEHTKTLFSALNWDMRTGNWNFNSQIYWRQHHDRFELFRNFEGADKYPWYKDHNYHQTDITGVKSVASNSWKWGKTSLGIDIRNEHIFSTVLGETIAKLIPVPFENGKEFTKEANRLLTTVFLDHSVNINRWFLSAGAALTNTEKFGTHINGGADVAYKFSDYSRIYVATNSAVRLPTFTDLYYQSAIQTSNPNLQPEKSLTLEVGTKINPLDWTLSAAGYYRSGKNIIDWVKTSDAEKWESRNLTQVNAAGIDLNFEYRFKNLYLQSAGVAYSYLNLDKKADGYDSKYALDYLKHKLIFNLNHSIWSKLSAHWALAFYDRSGNYYDYAAKQSVEYKPYWMLNTKFLWKEEKISFFAEVNNLLNQNYMEFGGIKQPGINFNTGIKLTLF
ncbi:MAG: TonB-dependent receptor [Paludibacteraceae bacterium]